MADLSEGMKVTIAGKDGVYEIKAEAEPGEYLCVHDTDAVLAKAEDITPA